MMVRIVLKMEEDEEFSDCRKLNKKDSSLIVNKLVTTLQRENKNLMEVKKW